MIKKLFKWLFILIFILCLGIVGIYMYAGEIVKFSVEKFLPEVTQTNVQLNRVDLSLLKGHVGVYGLSIANPQGYGADDAFSLKQISVSFDPKSVLTDKIIINQILIDGTHVSAEATYQNGKITSNLTQIQQNVESYLNKVNASSNQKASESKSQAQTGNAEGSAGKQVVIRDLQINNSELTVGVMKQVVSASLPDIQKKNIGEQGQEFSWKDAVAYIFNLISAESVKGTVGAVQKALRQGALQIVGTAKDTLNAVKESAKESADNAVKDITGNAVDAVKGLFGK